MCLLLLVFGAVLGVAGAVLTIAGVSLRDGSVDAGILTPGIVATERIAPSLPAIMLANPADAEVVAAAAGKGANGTSAGRAADPANIRPVTLPLEHRKGPAFDLLWHKGQRPQRAVEVKSSQTDVVPAMEAAKAAEQGNGSAPDVDAATAGTSVLKSGVVNGMPYTLYSDGSIEAQLPEGVLRFGSITELRDHIEQSA